MKIDVKKLSFEYKNNIVLDSISFSATTGDFICVLGKNGAGKSTLLKCISKILKAKSGEITIDNKSINKITSKKYAQLISYVPQNYSPVYSCTVSDFLLMGRNPYLSAFDTLSSNDKKIVQDILDEFKMGKYADTKISQLSGGEQKKLLLMRALVQETPIIVLDEPTNQLDYGTKTYFMEMLKRLAEKGKIIIISTHVPEDALNYATKTIIINDKTNKIYDKESLTEEELMKLYSVRLELIKGNCIQKSACVSMTIKEDK